MELEKNNRVEIFNTGGLMKKENLNIKLVLYIISSIALGGFNIKLPIYVVFSLVLIYNILKAIKCRKKIIYKETALEIIMFCSILPNNEIIIIVSFMCMIFYLIGFSVHSKDKKMGIGLAVLIGYLIINNIINNSSFINVILFILFNFTIIFYYFFFKNILSSEVLSLKIIKYLKEILLIELTANLSILIFNLNEIRKFQDLDWSTGTFGTYQQNILMNVCIFIAIIFAKEYYYSKKKEYIKGIILSIILAMSTGTIANSIIFFSIIVFTFIFSARVKLRKKVSVLTLLMIAIALFVTFNPAWVTKDILGLKDREYLLERIEKIESYEDVFIEIPKKDIKFLLFGNGMGQFSSRAALTATGEYIDFYNKIAQPSMSDYTYTYVYPKMLHFTGKGVVAAPYSSIISIQSELGLIGLVIYLLWMTILISRKDILSKIAILYFIGILFIDNYIEFSKVVLFFWIAYFYRLEDYKTY